VRGQYSRAGQESREWKCRGIGLPHWPSQWRQRKPRWRKRRAFKSCAAPGSPCTARTPSGQMLTRCPKMMGTVPPSRLVSAALSRQLAAPEPGPPAACRLFHAFRGRHELLPRCASVGREKRTRAGPHWRRYRARPSQLYGMVRGLPRKPRRIDSRLTVRSFSPQAVQGPSLRCHRCGLEQRVRVGYQDRTKEPQKLPDLGVPQSMRHQDESAGTRARFRPDDDPGAPRRTANSNHMPSPKSTRCQLSGVACGQRHRSNLAAAACAG
jgi:hypothetical protein